MADKVNNINLPDGTTIPIPAWASEETMSQVVAYMSATNKVDQRFIKLVDNLGGDLQTMQRAVSQLTNTVKRESDNSSQTDKEQANFAKKVVGSAKAINKLAGVFGDAEKPLSSLASGASSLTKSLNLGDRLLGAFGTDLANSSTAAAALAGATDVAVDAVLAYVGWNAAKIEQFSAAQRDAIDAGILFQRGAAAYDDLRHTAINSGVTYTELIRNASQFGSGMLALGSDMGSGTQNFARFFGELNRATDTLGDLGMSSSEMMGAYAEYLDYARRTGRVNRDLNRSAEDINNEFINLQIEAGAVANLTSLSRSEAMRRRMQSVDEFGQGALQIMRSAGLPSHAAVSESIIGSLGLLAPESGSIQTLLDAFQQELFEKADDPSNFDLSARLQTMMPGLETALNNAMPGFVDNIEQMVRDGNMPPDQAQAFIMNAINNANLERQATQGAAADSVAGMTNKLQAEILNMRRTVSENLGDPDRVQTERDAQRRDLREAGRVTQEMNDMTRRFLQVQETLTMEMETISGLFDRLTTTLRAGEETITQLLNLAGINSVNDFGGISEEPESLFRVLNSDGTVSVTTGGGSRPVGGGGGPVNFTPSNFNPSTLGTATQTDVTQDIVSTERGGGVNQAQDHGGARQQGLDERLVAILHQAGLDAGVNVVVGSGGQMTVEEARALGATQRPGTSTWFLPDGTAVRTGSTRHDHGNAADISFTDPATGRRLDMTNAADLAQIQEFVRSARELGATGIGSGDMARGVNDYMGRHTIHVGFGGEAAWGDDGESAFTPQWLRDIYSGTQLGTRASEITARRTTTDDPHTDHDHDHDSEEVRTARAAFFSEQELGTYFEGLGRAGQDQIFQLLMGAADDAARAQFLDRLRREPSALNENTLQQLNITPQTENFANIMNSFADFLEEQIEHFDEVFDEQLENPARRLFGGLVQPNLPYLVGDQLGLNTAEMFVPQTAGTIVNNRELRSIIDSSLTNITNSVSMQDVDLSGLLESKQSVISMMNSLHELIRRLNRQARDSKLTDITNSR